MSDVFCPVTLILPNSVLVQFHVRFPTGPSLTYLTNLRIAPLIGYVLFNVSRFGANIYTLIILRLVNPSWLMEGEIPREDSWLCMCVCVCVSLSVC
jgi:hypothetical protein